MATVSAVPLKLDEICKMLSINEDRMVNLDLTGAYIGDSGAKALGLALKNNTKLQTLSLGYNLISFHGAMSLIKEGMIKNRNNNIRKLDLRGNSIGDHGAFAIADYLLLSSCKNNNTNSINNKLIHLVIRDNEITSSGFEKLAYALENNTSLQSLDVGSNRIGEPSEEEDRNRYEDDHYQVVRGANAIFNLIRKNRSIKVLNLWSNGIDKEGIKLIAKSVRKNTILEHLNLGGNFVGNTGAKEIARVLLYNTSLKSLYMSNSCIACPGAMELAKALMQNQTLVTLDVMHNPKIGFDGSVIFCSVLRHCNSQLRELRLDYQQICYNSNCGDYNTTQHYYRKGGNSCCSSSSISAEINVYLRWNRNGRAESFSNNPNYLPLGTWADILQRLHEDPDLMYLMLLEKPDLIQQGKEVGREICSY